MKALIKENISSLQQFSKTMVNLEFFILFLFSILPISTSQNCPVSRCRKNSIPIRFPFRLEGQQLKYCGYPGFDLSCNNQSKTVLNLPYSGDFLVRNIDYTSQQIQLYDSNNCLAERLMSLNLSRSSFVPEAYENYTFLRCPTSLVDSRFITISCLSNSTISVLATSSVRVVASLSASCMVITSTLVPLRFSGQQDEFFSSQLDDDLELRWNSPDCGECEGNGGICGFKSNISLAIGCFHKDKEKSSNAFQSLRVWLPIITSFAIVIGIIIIFMILIYSYHPPVTRRANQTTPVLSLEPPQPAIQMVGLDQRTIESYQKVTLGDSMRLPKGPNDRTCAICLSEYHSQEVLRCIPECNHCFHAGCVDEWLRLNNSCPVCRKSPAPSPAGADTVS